MSTAERRARIFARFREGRGHGEIAREAGLTGRRAPDCQQAAALASSRAKSAGNGVASL
jgi:hypothetical protein